MPIRITGLTSGLDTEAIISALVSSYNYKTNKYKKAQTKLSWKQDAWKTLNTKIYSLYSSVGSMKLSTAYNLKSTTVSDSTKATVKAGNNAPTGTQQLNILKVAQAGYLTGAQLSSKTTTSTTLAELGYTGGDAKINLTKGDGTTKEITVTQGSTVGDVIASLKDAGVSANDLHKVLLVGGSTRVPAVQEIVKKITGKEPDKGINPDECVAIGAAIQGGVLSGDVKDLVLLDVTPLSLGIETLGGVFTKLIERNTTIPTKKSQVFSTAADGQTSVEIHVLQGEREMAAYNKTLGRFQLTGIPAAPRGVPQIEVTFDIDANGIVHVSAKDMATGNSQQVAITASTNLTDEDIEKAVKDAEAHAEEDKKRKDEIEVRNNAESLVYNSQKTIDELGDKISGEEKAKVETEIENVKKALEGSNVEEIKTATEKLTTAFYAVSEKLYSQAADANKTAGAQPDGEPKVDENGNVYDADYKVENDDNGDNK